MEADTEGSWAPQATTTEEQMADEVHVHESPPPGGGRDGTPWIMGLLVVLVLAIVLWFAFGRTGGETTKIDMDVDLNLPEQTDR